jgi:hypothetical protein
MEEVSAGPDKVKNGRNGSCTISSERKKKKKTSKNNGDSKGTGNLTTKKADDDCSGGRRRRRSSRALLNGSSSQGLSYDDDVDDQEEDPPTPLFRRKRQVEQQQLRRHELPDPDEMMASLTSDIRTLKVECKRLFDEMERTKTETDAAVEEAMVIKRKLQIEKLRGNELIKVDHLLRLGFDEGIVREHLKEENKLLEKDYRTRQRDVKNLEANISKMTTMNKECEKAVTAAHGAFGPLIVKQQTLQAKLEQAELELYSVETMVKHKRNMKSVEFSSKDKFKLAMKEIVKEIQKRCKDGKLTRDVLKVAGQKMSTDLGMENTKSDYSDDSSSASSSDLSSVEVSSVESDG